MLWIWKTSLDVVVWECCSRVERPLIRVADVPNPLLLRCRDQGSTEVTLTYCPKTIRSVQACMVNG